MILKQISSLEKVFIDDKPEKFKELCSFSALLGESFNYQIIARLTSDYKRDVDIEISSPLKEYISVYEVLPVPSQTPVIADGFDDDYIKTSAGLFPDALVPSESIRLTNRTKCLWVNVKISQNIKGGKYPITIYFGQNQTTFILEVIEKILPEQKTVFTQWFHADAIINYFGTRAFSKRFWEITENYIKTACECGINMLLTPIFTPPLDTEIGKERKTVQLVGVEKRGEKYLFDFSNFEKWVEIAKRQGIKYFEMSHLFTQWGATATPKIIASVNGKQKRIFGWDKAADSKEYDEFLSQFIPELLRELYRLGISDKTYFHISDEPNREQIESYKKARGVLKKYLGEHKITDAISNYEFYEMGLIENPVVIISRAEEFSQKGVKNLWIYTCCGPAKVYSNRFMSMPSARTRVIGAQMYKYSIAGYLHWGYNFYNSALSKRAINPYITTDADCSFPSGDAFSVYPYKKGAIHSIRSRVFYDALQDIRAFCLLEEKLGKEKTRALIEEYGIHSFSEYSHKKLLDLRAKINQLISEV